MDVARLAEFTEKYDKRFTDEHPGFVKWWATHRHNDPDPRYSTPARIAYKCAVFYDEYWSAKKMGAV